MVHHGLGTTVTQEEGGSETEQGAQGTEGDHIAGREARMPWA